MAWLLPPTLLLTLFLFTSAYSGFVLFSFLSLLRDIVLAIPTKKTPVLNMVASVHPALAQTSPPYPTSLDRDPIPTFHPAPGAF